MPLPAPYGTGPENLMNGTGLSPMVIAKVEPLLTTRALRGPFDYRVPERLLGVGVGSVLLVPFGRRRVVGVVVDVAESSDLPPDRLAEPISALEAGATPELIRVGLWVAREYCSTPARGLELVLPPGVGRGGRGPGPRLERLVRLAPAGRAALDDGTRLGRVQRRALVALADADGEVAAEAIPADGQALRRLEARGLVELGTRQRVRRPTIVDVGAPSVRPRLSADQSRALGAIVEAMEGGKGGELLLHGVTGSGKTEVYLAAAEDALARGRGAIVLVPEIALAPQAVSRFAARFGDRVALLHSRLSAGERRDEWERLRTGEADVCVGPRSAVFAPVRDLGMIVVDEEHDASYKQEGDPRYDAREVALHRAREAGAVLVCGSATPRPESWERLRRVELPERVDGASLPEVEVLDMRAGSGADGPLHPRTLEALSALRDAGGKAIVMLNRRGWSPFLSCRSCGHAWGCPECDVSLVVHKRERELRCHHCGHAESLPDSCPVCGSVTLARHGAGTERVADLLSEAASPLPVFRLDSDSAAPAGAHLEILKRFEDADGGVLVGTQMVGKGHDFPDVVLSVVLDADATLRFPDFRSEERTFALVAQLAGRSGRGSRGGSVLVQTLAPDAPAITHAARHDAAGFLATELERRRTLRYPPFSHLVRVELTAPEAETAQAAADLARERFRGSIPDGVELLGPAPRFRLRGRHRRQLLIKAAEREPTVGAIRGAVEDLAAARALRGVAISVDVDPQ
jgi:primosomal protein N' (replication factor Y) (superfamily II helicase)